MAEALTSVVIVPQGDTALTIRAGDRLDDATRDRVRAIARTLEASTLPGGAEVVAGYLTVTVHYDPVLVSDHDGLREAAPFEVMRRHVASALDEMAGGSLPSREAVEIPVCYGGAFGPDLEEVASHAGFAPGEIIRRHVARTYRVELLGFLPGFGYLSGLDPALAMPRRTTPRTRVPAGAVGIAELQTGVYPLESPGGWRLIGRSPITFFDATRDPPTLLAPDDLVRFRAIDAAEFVAMAAQPGMP